MGEYKEKLKSGGELVVNATNWEINYYFPGPDRRYNGTFFSINGKDIDRYINAWKNNFNKYQLLKATLELEGSYEVKGEAGMMIRVGGWHDGVCLYNWKMNVRNQERLNQIINDYEQSKETAIKVQALLKSLL